MKQFSIRLDDRLLSGLDEMTANGVCIDRMDAIRRCIQMGIMASKETRLAAIGAWAEVLEAEADNAT